MPLAIPTSTRASACPNQARPSNAPNGRHPIPRFVQEVQEARIHSANKVYLPPSFICVVIPFVASGIRHDQVGKVPRILMVEGGSGVGKTLTIRETLNAGGIHIVDLEVAMLESNEAGAPSKYFLRKVQEASNYIDEHGPAVLMGDDTDLVRSENTTDSTGTRNTLQLNATIQRYCDNPTLILGQPCNPIPIIETVNDTSVFSESAIRYGRVKRYCFNPTGEELLRMAWANLRGLLTREQFMSVVRLNNDWRIVHFRNLVERIEQIHQRDHFADLSLKQLFDLDSPDPLCVRPRKLSPDELRTCIEAVESGQTRRSYLA